jgi:hypothetical protein
VTLRGVLELDQDKEAGSQASPIYLPKAYPDSMDYEDNEALNVRSCSTETSWSVIDPLCAFTGCPSRLLELI